MNDMKHAIAVKTQAGDFLVTKIFFGKDGSYYVAVPYHSSGKAIFMVQTINYTTSTPRAVDDLCKEGKATDAIILGVADNDRIKLSHHPDGFVQFSGGKLTSGKHPDGSPKGIGIQSWQLGSRCDGPAFAVFIGDITEFVRVPECDDCILLDAASLNRPAGCTSLALEGHYFPPIWRRFIRRSAAKSHFIEVQHPSGAILHMPTIIMPDDCAIPGFIGLDLYYVPLSDKFYENQGSSRPYFTLSGPSGNVRANENRESVGDGLFCVYSRDPRAAQAIERDLTFQSPTNASSGIGDPRHASCGARVPPGSPNAHA